MSTAIIVSGSELAPQAVELLVGYELVFSGQAATEQELMTLCKAHDPVGIILRYGKIGAGVMDAAPSLKVISKHGSGTDTIDKQAAQARGITVAAAVGANAAAVSEQAVALLLACAKSVVQLNARMHAGHWDKATHKSIQLSGRTIGVIGLGAIGQRCAKAAHGLGMRVIGFDPYTPSLPDYIQPVCLNQLWREADAISLHCPLTDDSRGLLNAKTIAQCKRGVIVVNTARGALIDEAALLAAVQSGHVACAGLDSFAIEPLTKGHPFLGQERIVLSPHVGGLTHEAYINMGVEAAKNLLAVLAP